MARPGIEPRTSCSTQSRIPRGTLQKVLWSIRGSYWAIWSLPRTNVKWHSDPWQTVTSQLIRLSTNFTTLIPSLTCTELWGVSIEHLQRVWYASRERFLFRIPGSVPPFWYWLVLQMLRPDSSNLPCPYSTFHLEYSYALQTKSLKTAAVLKEDEWSIVNFIIRKAIFENSYVDPLTFITIS